MGVKLGLQNLSEEHGLIGREKKITEENIWT